MLEKMKSVVVAINNFCMLKCRHCYNKAIVTVHKESDFFTEDFFNSLLSIGVKQIALSGGEPLLSYEILINALRVIKKRVPVILTTNGLLLNKHKINELNSLGVTIIQVSLDGSTCEIHEYLRGEGTFYPTVKCISDQHSNIVPIFTIHGKNYHDVQNYLDFLIENGITRVGFERYIPVSIVPENKELTLTREQLESAYKIILNYENKLNIHVNDPLYNVYKSLYYKIDPSVFDVFYDFGCKALNHNIYIDVDGNVYPCTFSSSSLFNVHSTPLCNKTIQEWQHIYNNNRVKDCGVCAYRKICGGCRAAAYSYSKDWFGRDPLCILH